jgi:hypothetical protein
MTKRAQFLSSGDRITGVETATGIAEFGNPFTVCDTYRDGKYIKVVGKPDGYGACGFSALPDSVYAVEVSA